MSFRQFIIRVYRIYQPFRTAVFLVFAMMLLTEIFYLINPYIYGKIIDGIVSDKPMIDVAILLLITLAISQINNFLGYIRERIEIKKLDFEVDRYIADETLRKIFNFSIGQHENQNSGNISWNYADLDYIKVVNPQPLYKKIEDIDINRQLLK